jgi:hypothetical protein
MQLSTYHISLLLGILFSGLYFFFRNDNKEYQRVHIIVFVILLTTIFSESIWQMAQNSGMDNEVLYNLLFVYLKIVVILVLFYHLPFSCQIQNKILLALILFIVAGIFISVFLQPISAETQTYTYLFGYSIILLLSLIFFKDIIRQSRYKDTNLLSLPYFWIATLVFFYFGESFVFFFFTFFFSPLETASSGYIHFFVQFFAGLMYLIFGLSFFAPYVFNKKY